MIRKSRRVFALTAVGVVGFAPVVSGCGAGRSPETAMPTQLTEGVNVAVPVGAARSQIDIRNMFLLGAPAGATAAPGGALPLYATMINQAAGRPDRLLSVSSPSFRGAQVTGGGIALPAPIPNGAGQAVRLATAPGQTPPVVLQGLTAPLYGGEKVSVTLRFEKAGSVTIPVPVVPSQGEYATYGAVPTPTPTQSPTRRGTPGTASPTVGQTVAPGATQPPAPTPTVPSASPH